MPALPALISPPGLLLWLAWNFAVLSSIQLTVRLIRAYSIQTTLLGALALTAATVPIALLYVLIFNSKLSWFLVPMVLTGLVGFAVADRLLHLKRLRARVAAAFGTALLSSPWPVFLGLGVPGPGGG